MNLQFFRDHLANELRDLPDVRSQNIQSYVLTTAVLARYIVDELGIEDLNVPAQYHPNKQSYPLKTILNSFVHYIVFRPPIWNLEREGSDYVFHLYSENNKRKGHDYYIRLNDFFELATRTADDDVFISNYLYRQNSQIT